MGTFLGVLGFLVITNIGLLIFSNNGSKNK